MVDLGVDARDEVGVAGYQVAREGVGERGEHVACGHDFVVDLDHG